MMNWHIISTERRVKIYDLLINIKLKTSAIFN